jgi:hypothetical protein
LKGNEWTKGDFRALLFDNSQGVFSGFMHLRLNDFLIDEKRTDVFKGILVETMQSFENKGAYILLEELNSFQKILETKHIWVEALDVSRPIKALQFLSKVVEDKFELTEEDNLTYEI